MKKNYICLCLPLLLFFISSAQQVAPGIQWQKCLAGSQDEYSGRIVRSTDGGYLVASITTSQDGDVIPHTGSPVIWVVKLSNTGLIVWQKIMAGGNDANSGYGIVYLKNTPDGGY